MATITFPTQQSGDVTLDLDDIQSIEAAGIVTIVTVLGGHPYMSPAPIEMFELTLAQGGGEVPIDTFSLARAPRGG